MAFQQDLHQPPRAPLAIIARPVYYTLLLAMQAITVHRVRSVPYLVRAELIAFLTPLSRSPRVPRVTTALLRFQSTVHMEIIVQVSLD